MGNQQDTDKFIEKMFSEMYRELKAFIYHYSYDKECVEDILQETYLAAFRHADELIGNEKYKSWMYATAVNKAKKMNKMNQKHSECVSLEDQIDLCVEPEFEFLRFSALRAAMAEGDYELLMLHYNDNYTYEELAEMFDKTPSYIKMRISRIVKDLKKKIKDREI